MPNPEAYKYTESHEWVKTEGSDATCGITDFAQEQLTDIVFVELPDTGKTVSRGDKVAVVESVKSVSDIYAPVSGTIAAVNNALSDSPELINNDPFEGGWIFKISMSDPSEVNGLLSKTDYEAKTAGGPS